MVDVRDATPADRSVLVGFMAALNAVEHQWESDRALEPAAADEHIAYLEGLVRDQAGFMLLAEENQQPAGFLVGIEEWEDGTYIVPEARRYGKITDLFVDDRSRGRGIARALLAEAERRFRANGLPAVQVTALAANEAARAAYRATGYRPLDVTYAKSLCGEGG